MEFFYDSHGMTWEAFLAIVGGGSAIFWLIGAIIESVVDKKKRGGKQ